LLAFQEDKDTLNRPGSRVTTVAQIKDETRITHRIPSKTGRRCFTLAEKLLYFS